MIQLKPTQLYAVQVPDDATDIKMNENELKYFISPRERHKVFDKNFELIGTYQAGSIDFDAGEYINKTIVPEYEKSGESFINKTSYVDYKYKGRFLVYSYYNALESLISLLEANQVPIMDNEKYCLLKLK